MLHKFQKVLRKKQTNAETLLWQHLRDRRLQGFKFRRQHIIQGYIVDFVCLKKKLVIELDGGQHATQQNYDNKRTQALEQDGFKVLRFWNNDVLENIEGVWDVIYSTLYPSPAPTGHPLPQGEREKIDFTSPLVGEVVNSRSK